jgi:ring-1,2-phenylacetyl-CoA epoxidase subunit PaaC
VSALAQDSGRELAAVRFDYLLQLADTSLILGQRLGELLGHAPALEEDLGLGNISLDLIGQARLLLSYAAEVEGRGRTEDQLAFLRVESEFRNLVLAEQPNGDFAQTIVRQLLIDAYQLELYEGLQASSDARLAALAAKSLVETRYHFRYSSGWLVRLGDGTEESHVRAQRALDVCWPYTRELFDEQEEDRVLVRLGIAPALGQIAAAWSARIDAVLGEATLQRPASVPYRWYGRRGAHSEHLGYMLADMQYLQRTYPGAQW